MGVQIKLLRTINFNIWLMSGAINLHLNMDDNLQSLSTSFYHTACMDFYLHCQLYLFFEHMDLSVQHIYLEKQHLRSFIRNRKDMH